MDDGLDCLFRIIHNTDGCCDSRIFNIGNPYNDYSIRDLAQMMIEVVKEFPHLSHLAERVEFKKVSSKDYYGPDYQDVGYRVPDISNARKVLGWEPRVGLKEALRKTISFYVDSGQIALDDLGRPGDL